MHIITECNTAGAQFLMTCIFSAENFEKDAMIIICYHHPHRNIPFRQDILQPEEIRRDLTK